MEQLERQKSRKKIAGGAPVKTHRSFQRDKKTKKRMRDRSRMAGERQAARLAGIESLTLWLSPTQKSMLQSQIRLQGWEVASPRAAVISQRQKLLENDMRPVAFFEPPKSVEEEVVAKSDPKLKKTKREKKPTKVAQRKVKLKFARDDLFGFSGIEFTDKAACEKGAKPAEGPTLISPPSDIDDPKLSDSCDGAEVEGGDQPSGK